MLAPSGSLTGIELEQRRIKAELLMAAAAALDLDALGVGEADLAFGPAFLREGAARNGLPYVSANVVDEAGVPLFPASVVVERAGLRIGVTAASREGLPGVVVRPATEAVRGVVAELRRDGVDHVVLLSHLGIDGDELIAEEVDGIDLIFGSHDRRHQTTPLIVGTTAIFQAGAKGKHLGQATVEFRRGATGWSSAEARGRALRRKETLTLQLEDYDRQIAEAADERTRSRLERIRGLTQRRLDDLVIPPADGGLTHAVVGKKIPVSPSLAEEPAMTALVGEALERLQATPDRGGAVRTWGDWVGGSQCIACHREEHVDWKESGHAGAWKSLVRERRQFDLDCWSCHVTGAGKPDGPTGPNQVGFLRDVQCEACHGPGRAHVADPTVAVDRSPGEALCLECHTPEQTEGRFVYEEYLRRVDHGAGSLPASP
jgi:hypothetical protein